MSLRALLCLLPTLLLAQPETPVSRRDLERLIQVLRPLHRPPAPPRPGDWAYSRKEPGQTFRQYLRCDPALPTPERRKVYVQPLGPFSPGQQRVLELTVEGLGASLGLPVGTLPPLPATAVPRRAQRLSQGPGARQFQTTFILEELLPGLLPPDAAACIALTAVDLWPGEGWNFVFGQATLRDRVGVWSLARLGNPDAGPEAFRLCLMRALGTAVHETCHMFSFRHCTAFACLMAGSNSLEEGDRHPFWLCPECLAKLCHATGVDPIARARRLEAFCSREGFPPEAAFFRLSAERLEQTWPRKPSPTDRGAGKDRHESPRARPAAKVPSTESTNPTGPRPPCA